MFRWPAPEVVRQSHRVRLLVTITGTIVKYDPGAQDDSGAKHQILTVSVSEFAAPGRIDGLDVGELIYVAIRYGDEEGIPEAIPDLAAGKEIEMRGAFISAADAREQEDGTHMAVLHFTHRPLGWVKYEGQTYR